MVPPPLAEAVEAMEKIKEAEKPQAETETHKTSTDQAEATDSGQRSAEETKRRKHSGSRTRVKGTAVNLEKLVIE